jgi:biopolymer transport protein ExbD
MRISKRARAASAMGLQMTSMIDLVFLLLIYFLLTLTLRTQEGFLGTETPPGQAQISQQQEEPDEEEEARVRVIRAADGVGLFFRDWPVAGYADLGRQIRALPAEMQIILEAAPDVPYRDVVRVHNIALKTGHRNVVYTVPPA